MGNPAARITDMHTCPMVTPGLPPVPHVGGPIVGPGCPTVLIGGMPASVVGDMCVCVGPPDSVIMGSTGVFFGGKPAVRMGDPTAHGGAVVLGCPTVLVGETSSGSGSGGSASPNPAVLSKLNSSGNPASPATAASSKAADNFSKKKITEDSIAFQVKDSDGNPISGVHYEVKLPSGKKMSGTTDDKGEVHIGGLDPGSCEVSFPDYHKDAWQLS